MTSVVLLAAETAAHAAEKAGWLLENAWIFPAIPFASFLIILLVGKRLPRKGAEVGVSALGLVFALAVVAGVQWINHVDAATSGAEEASSLNAAAPARPIQFFAEPSGNAEKSAEPAEEEHAVTPVVSEWKSDWWTVGGVDFGVGTFVDGPAVMMLFVVGLVSLLVHIYSTDYVAGDVRFTHFFAFLSLFTASMLLLVLANNLVMFITAWELVGVCSFVLIGHWWEEKANSDAALKAFLTNRVGDIGLLIGMTTLFFTAGGGKTFNIEAINTAAASGGASHTALLVASLCLLAAVMSKSGQFALHTWLPDAMAGPT